MNFVTKTLTAAVKNSAYTVDFELAGATGDSIFSLFRGALPAGLTLDPDGTLHGTSTVFGLFAFELKAVDSLGATAYRIFTLLVKNTGGAVFTVYESATEFRAGAPEADSNGLLVRGDILGFYLESYNAAGAVTFSDNGAGGIFGTPSGNRVKYKAANCTQIVTFTVSDGTTTRTLSATFYATFPLNASWGGQGTIDRDTKIQKAKGGVEYSREEDDTIQTGQLTVSQAEQYEYDLGQNFWIWHRKVRRFYYLDMDNGELFLVKFTSEYSWKKNGADNFEIYANIKGYFTGLKIDLTGYAPKNPSNTVVLIGTLEDHVITYTSNPDLIDDDADIADFVLTMYPPEDV